MPVIQALLSVSTGQHFSLGMGQDPSHEVLLERVGVTFRSDFPGACGLAEEESGEKEGDRGQEEVR